MVSPWDETLARPELRKETKAFPLKNGQTLTLTLEDLGPFGEGAFLDLARTLVERHVEQKKPLISPRGKIYKLSRHMCGVIAHLVTMQRANPEEDYGTLGFQPISVIDWCGWADTTAWESIETFLGTFFEADLGNSTRSDPETTEPTGNVSPPPAELPASTPNSPPAPTPSCDPSTIAPAPSVPTLD